MLPPDNFQEDPRPVLAHRTSPTNIGLYLLAAASAHDFGWAGVPETVERLEATLATMGRLPRFHGHFYNWYDTRDLRPLDPRYISSVDSGNLAGHLIALANAFRDWCDRPLAAARRLGGIVDALELARRSGGPAGSGRARAGPGCSLHDALGVLIGGHPAVRPGPGRSARAPRRAGRGRGRSRPRARRRSRRRRRGGPGILGRSRRDARSKATTRSCPGRGSRRQSAAAARGAGGYRPRLGAGDGFRLPVRSNDASCSRSATWSREGALDPSCYDLLASEARLASFIAIAKGDIPVAPLVPARPRRHAGRARRGADLLVGLDVRIPDAVAGDARAGGQPDRSRPAG